MAARVHPNFSEIGFTNSVQPYWRFAIIAMQTMPMKSCSHRYDAGRVMAVETPLALSFATGNLRAMSEQKLQNCYFVQAYARDRADDWDKSRLEQRRRRQDG